MNEVCENCESIDIIKALINKIKLNFNVGVSYNGKYYSY